MKRKKSTAPAIRQGETVYCKYNLADEDGSTQLGSMWYKGTIIKVVKQNHKMAVGMVEYEDKEICEFEFNFIENPAIWRFDEPASYKKQKNSEPSNIDYDLIIDKVCKRLASEIKKDKGEIEKMIDERIGTHLKKIRVEMPIEFLHGDMPDSVRDKFDAVAVEEKNKYQGTSLAGVVNTKTDKGKTMCAYYKNLHFPCASKKFDTKTGFYMSNSATKVHLARFGEQSLRNLPAEAVFNSIKNKSLCPSCVSKYCEGDYFMNYVKKKENCAICKCHRPSTNHDDSDDKIPICNGCVGANDPNANNEKFYMAGLTLLPKIFSKYDLKLQRSTCVTAFNNTQRSIDFTMNGKIGTSRFVILIEMDQDQHKKYDAKEERKKTAEQSAFMMKENGYDKIFVIRFNPNIGWRENSDDERVARFNYKERMLVLRSWIIWYIVNYASVRDCLIMYLWYDCDRKKDLYEHGFDGFGMAYNAPMMPASANWIYCADPSERLSSVFDNVNHRRVEVERVFKYWKLEDQVEKFPTSIQVAMV